MDIIGQAFVQIVPESGGFVGGVQKALGFLSNPLALVTTGAVAAGVALLDIGKKFHDSYSQIEVGTGATGAALKGLEGDFKSVLSNTAGSFSQVSAAITVLYDRTHLTGKALDDFAAKEVTLARITKTDINANLQDTTAIFNQFGIAANKQSGELDVLFKASQKSGVGFTDFTSQMKTATPVAQILGLSVNQTAAFVSNLAASGVPATKVMMALGSEFSKAAKAGKDPTVVINDMVNQLKAAPSATAAAEIAITKFGVGAKQAATFVDAVRSGTFNFGATLKAITDGKGGINQTSSDISGLGGKFLLLRNKMLNILEPISTGLYNLANKGLGEVIKVLPSVMASIDVFVGKAKVAWGAFMEGFSNPKGKSALTGFIGSFIKFGQDVKQAFDVVKDATVAAFGFIMDHKAEIVGAFETVGKVIGKSFGFLMDHKAETLAAITVIAAAIAVNMVPVFIAWAAATAALVVEWVILWAPVIALVAGIAALAAGFVYAYKHFKIFRDVVNEVATILKLVLVGAFRLVIDYTKTFLAVFMDIIHFFEDIFHGKWGKAFNDLADIPKRVLGLVVKLFKDLGPSILEAMSAIGDLAIKGAELLGSFLLGMVGKLPDLILWIALLPAKLLLGLGELALQWIPKGVELLGGLLAGLVQKLPDIALWLALLPLKILAFAVGFEVALVVRGVELIVGLLNGLIAAVPAIWDWFTKLPGRILELFVTVAKFEIRGIEAVAGFLAGLVQKIPEVLNWFLSLPGQLLGAFITAGKFAVRGVEAVAGILAGLVQKIPDVLNWFAGLPGRLISAIGDVAGQFFHLGQSIVNGIINGIGDIASALANKIGNAVTGAYNFGMKLIHGNSPSKLFATMGKSMTDGIGVGLQDTALFDAGFKNIMGKTTAFVASMPTLPGAGGGSNVPPGMVPASAAQSQAPSPIVNLTIHPAPGQSETMIGQVAAAEIAWQLKPVGTGGR